MSTASSLFSSTFSITPQLVRRSESAAFAQLEEVIELAAQRHREGKTETARNDTARAQSQKSDITRRENISETRSQDLERRTQDLSQERHEDRENYLQRREQNANERAAQNRSAIAARETAGNERNFSQAISSAKNRLIAAPSAVVASENFSPRAGNEFSSSSRTSLTSSTTISPNANSPSPKFLQDFQNTHSPLAVANVAPQPTVTTTASQTAQAASVAFTIFNPSGKLRARRDEEQEKSDSEISENSPDARSEPAEKPLKHAALELFSTLFPPPKEKENSVGSFAKFSPTSARQAHDELENEKEKKSLTPRAATTDFATTFLRETPNEKSPAAETKSETTQRDSIELIQRVVAALQSAANRGDIVRIRLHPESLGSVAVRIKIQSGKMSATLRVENEAARELLLANQNTLRKRLNSNGIEVEEFVVEIFIAGGMEAVFPP